MMYNWIIVCLKWPCFQNNGGLLHVLPFPYGYVEASVFIIIENVFWLKLINIIGLFRFSYVLWVIQAMLTTLI
jgi:hypothetical protein